jgi:hypothetical protein
MLAVVVVVVVTMIGVFVVWVYNRPKFYHYPFGLVPTNRVRRISQVVNISIALMLDEHVPIA